MIDQPEFLVDVGLTDLPMPIRVASREEPEGQATVAGITINARIMGEFEARWIDTFVRIVHEHRGRIGTATLKENIHDYVRELKAMSVKVDFDYPFFVEKTTPVSHQPCLVRYLCRYTAKMASVDEQARAILSVQVPCLTTYPGSAPENPRGLFAQLTTMTVEVEAGGERYPEDLVELVDRHAIAPVYSYLNDEDQLWIIERAHSEERSSVTVANSVKSELAADPKVNWYSVRAANFGMLHSYSTVIGTEKSSWVPASGFVQEV